jgi:hypothetical protein
MAYLMKYHSNDSRVLNLFRVVNAIAGINAKNKDKIRY